MRLLRYIDGVATPHHYYPESQVIFAAGLAAGPLHLHHIRPEVAEHQRRRRAVLVLRKVEDLDAAQRAVAELRRDHPEAGRFHYQWDGRDDSGKTMPSGVYFYEVQTETERQARKMILLQ